MTRKRENRKEEFADYVQRIMREKGLNTETVEERSDSKGNKIASSYVRKIIAGSAGNLSVDKLRALADGLGRPFMEVLMKAGGEVPEDDPDFLQSEIAEMWKMMKELKDPGEKEYFRRRIKRTYEELERSLAEERGNSKRVS